MLNIRTIGKFDSQDICEAVLQHGNQSVAIMNYGCVVRDWQVATASGLRHVVLGFETFEPYPQHSPSFGIIAGRVANRTALGRFSLGPTDYQLTCNDGAHHLHGGIKGLGKSVWHMHADTAGNAVQLSYLSIEGEQGYPGEVNFTVTFTLDDDGLHCRMQGMPDCPTPINLAQHNYYNLDGVGNTVGDPAGSDAVGRGSDAIRQSSSAKQHPSSSSYSAGIRQHQLQVNAEDYLPVDEGLIPTGLVEKVQGTRFDFTALRRIDEADPQCLGHDHNVVLASDRSRDKAVAILQSSDAEITLELYSDQAGIQLYSGKKLNVAVNGHNAASYRSFAGLCLEPQGFPDALNNPDWPSIICTPEQPYLQNLTMRIRGG